MVKVERSFPAPASLALESQKANGSYSMPDVVKQLKEDFHNKCYICELNELQDAQVEHLLPHLDGKYPKRSVFMTRGLSIAVRMIQKRWLFFGCRKMRLMYTQ